MDNQASIRRWTSRTADVKMEAVGPMGGDHWEVSFSDRGTRASKGSPSTCEKFQVDRARVENLIISLSTADRGGKKACENEYMQQWNELRKGGVSESLTCISRSRGRGLSD